MSSPLSVSRPVALVCACGGCALLLMTVLWSGKWTQGSPQVRLSVGILLLALALLSILLLDRSEVGRDGLLLALLPVGAAFFLRAACLDYASYDYRDFLAQWAAFFRDNGGFAAIREQVGDYNVPYLYFMAAISYLPMPDLYAIKLFSILFDVILAWGGLRLAQKLAPGRPEAGYLAFLALLLLPTVVLNGSYWGQCDSLYGALVLHALACALEKRPIPSMILLAVAFSFKLQTVFLLPLWGAFWLCGVVKFRHLLVFPVTYFVTALPALLLCKPLGDILGVYVKQAGQYDQKLVYNAPTVFALIPGGIQLTDAEMALLSKVGIGAAFLLCLVVMGVLFHRRKALSPALWAAGGAVLAVGIPYLLPYMHERYFFLADVLTLAWACADRRRLPLAAVVQLGSLASYAVYLRLKYNFVLQAFGQYWVMGVESLIMLCALVVALVSFFRLPEEEPFYEE